MSSTTSLLLTASLSTSRTLIGLSSILFPKTALSIFLPSSSLPSLPSASTTHLAPSSPLSLITRLFAARELVLGVITLQTLYQHTRNSQITTSKSSKSKEGIDKEESREGEGEVRRRLKYLLYAGVLVDSLDLASCVVEYVYGGGLEFGGFIVLGSAAVGAILAAEVAVSGL